MKRRHAVLLLAVVVAVLWVFEVLLWPFRQRGVSWPSRPNVGLYGAWYGWPWHSRLPSGRLYRAELWLLSKRWDLAVAAFGRERARPFDFIPF